MTLKGDSDMSKLFVTSAMVAVLALVGVSANADLLPPQSTITTYDATSGQTTFQWDQDSQFDIVLEPGQTEPQVTVIKNDLPGGSLYQFIIPNFYDPLPVKNISIAFFGQNSGATTGDFPFVLDIVGADSEFGTDAPAVPVFGDIVDRTESPTLVTESWIMFPNPDFEVVKFFAPFTYELGQVEIFTESIPEPASVALFGLGSVLLLARKRRAA